MIARLLRCEHSRPWESGGEYCRPQIASVGSFAANDYGLYEMVDNAAEWGRRLV